LDALLLIGGALAAGGVSFLWSDTLYSFYGGYGSFRQGSNPHWRGWYTGINYFSLQFLAFPIPVAYFTLRYLQFENTIKQPSFAAKLMDLQMTPLPASEIARHLLFRGFFPISLIVLFASLVGSYLASNRRDIAALAGISNPAAWDSAYFEYERCIHRLYSEDRLLPLLFLMMVFVWVGLLTYLQVKRLLGQWFHWPDGSRRACDVMRYFLILVLPLLVQWCLAVGIDTPGQFQPPFTSFVCAVFIIFLGFVVLELLMYRRVEWRQG
jgi:hypothetical protein